MSETTDRTDTCLMACLDAMDNCSMLTDYLTAVVCYQNYSGCADSCHDIERPEGFERSLIRRNLLL